MLLAYSSHTMKNQLALTVAWHEKEFLGKQGLHQVEAASALTGQGVTGSCLSLAAFIQILGTGSTHNRCSSGVCSASSTKLLAPYPSPETMALSGQCWGGRGSCCIYCLGGLLPVTCLNLSPQRDLPQLQSQPLPFLAFVLFASRYSGICAKLFVAPLDFSRCSLPSP